MLTVKHINEVNDETILQGEQISTGENFVSVDVGAGEKNWVPLVGGRVFVMNDAGKTVASYNLSETGNRKYDKLIGKLITSLALFDKDPADSDYQKGYEAAIKEILEDEGLLKKED